MMPPVAMKLSMIVEITSLTPRVTFRRPARPAHRLPTTMAVRRMMATWNGPGSSSWAPTQAATNEASTYCPSTPMLKRFILKPMATATPAMNSGVARLRMSIMFSSFDAVEIISV